MFAAKIYLVPIRGISYMIKKVRVARITKAKSNPNCVTCND